jgi:hypothetical protein
MGTFFLNKNKEAVVTMYNQQNYQSSGMNIQPTTTQSQFRGMQRQQYQPAGQVQSYYQGIGQSMNQYPTSTGSQYQSQGQGQYGQQTQFSSPEQFHGSNYRGDQSGHDSYLRADSTSPSQFGMGSQFGFQNIGQSTMSNQFGFQGQGGQGGQGGQFHTANYRGNQAGHDSYLRADSTSPSQFGTQGQFGSQGQFGTQGQFGMQNQIGMQNSGMQSPQSFHTASYQGNQMGHDSNLRADSTQPSNMQQQFGYRS